MSVTINGGITFNGGFTLKSQVVDPYAPTVSSESPFAGLQSYFFEGTQSRLQYNASNLSLGTDWTIEWFQKETIPNNFPRPFCVGNNLMGVSMEGGEPGTFYIQENSNYHNIYSVTRRDAWHHFAISSVGGTVTVYQDGIHRGSTFSFTGVDTTGQTLFLAGKAGALTTEYFGGYITDMRWTVGVGVYTGDFTVPSTPLQLTQSSGTNIQAITSGQVKFFLEPGRDYLA
jgi:hypothetical protein